MEQVGKTEQMYKMERMDEMEQVDKTDGHKPVDPSKSRKFTQTFKKTKKGQR